MKFFKRYSFILILALLIVIVLFSGISLKDIFESLRQLSPVQILLLVSGFLFISLYTIAGKKILFYFLGYSVPFKSISLIHFASISAHYATPAKIGFPVAVYLLKKVENIPVSVSTASIVVELSVSMLLTGIIGFAGSLVYFSEKASSFSAGLIITVSVLIFLGLLLIFVYRRSSKARQFLSELKTAIMMLSFSKIIIYVFFQAVLQIIFAAYLVLIVYFFDTEINIWYAIIANSSAYFIGAISMMPLGLGTRDVSMLWYLKAFGVAGNIGMAAVVLQRVITISMAYLLGFLSAGYLGVKSMSGQNEK